MSFDARLVASLSASAGEAHLRGARLDPSGWAMEPAHGVMPGHSRQRPPWLLALDTVARLNRPQRPIRWRRQWVPPFLTAYGAMVKKMMVCPSLNMSTDTSTLRLD